MIHGCGLWVVGCDYRDGHGMRGQGRDKRRRRGRRRRHEDEDEDTRTHARTCTTKFHPGWMEGASNQSLSFLEPGSHGRTRKTREIGK